MNLKNPKVVLGLAGLIAAIFIGGALLIVSGDDGPERTSNLDPTTTTDTSIDFDALYSEVISAFSIDESQLQSFVFFGDDKVIYQDSVQIYQVYNAGNGWVLGYSGNEAPSCEEVADIPDGFRISCDADPETGIVATEGDWTTNDPNYYNYIEEKISEMLIESEGGAQPSVEDDDL